MQISTYNFFTQKRGIDLHIACVADLHARPYGEVIDALEQIQPKIILLPGDIVEIAAPYRERRNLTGLEFLKKASEVAPTYYTYGNHETYNCHTKDIEKRFPNSEMYTEYKKIISSYGVHIINDCFEELGDTNVKIGGLVCGKSEREDLSVNEPDIVFLKDFSLLEGYKILLCHYPHYYEKYLKDKNFDLILSGHAHGGQWRIFGHGVYAPHQGLFPQYTSGVHDEKLLISRGVSNNAKPIPRLFNRREVLDIRIKSK